MVHDKRQIRVIRGYDDDDFIEALGSRDEIERKNFRKLLRWLYENDSALNEKVFKNLNSLYDLGNNYVHPKAGHDAKEESLKALHLIGESLFQVFGVGGVDDLIGRPFAHLMRIFRISVEGTISFSLLLLHRKRLWIIADAITSRNVLRTRGESIKCNQLFPSSLT
jgi:hypothetical protein